MGQATEAAESNEDEHCGGAGWRDLDWSSEMTKFSVAVAGALIAVFAAQASMAQDKPAAATPAATPPVTAAATTAAPAAKVAVAKPEVKAAAAKVEAAASAPAQPAAVTAAKPAEAPKK